MVRIPGFHPGGPGSIPGCGTFLLMFMFLCRILSPSLLPVIWSCSTLAKGTKYCPKNWKMYFVLVLFGYHNWSISWLFMINHKFWSLVMQINLSFFLFTINSLDHLHYSSIFLSKYQFQSIAKWKIIQCYKVGAG